MENNEKTAVISRRTNFDDRRVCSAACDSYELDRICDIIDRFFYELGADKLITPSCKVVIKPNLVIRRSPE